MNAAPEELRQKTRPDVEFRIATADDDAGLRRLLRENPMAGDIHLSFEREPDYFAASAIEGPQCRTIVAIDKHRVVCAGSISVRLRYVNGEPMRVGYLGGLRLDKHCRNHISIIRRGYELFHRLHEQGGPPIYLTSIVADNAPARRLLERGLPGMPTYRFLGEFSTLVMRSERRSSIGETRRSAKPTHSEVVNLLNRDLSRYQFAPVWRDDDLSAGPVTPEFHIDRDGPGGRAACAALWDQIEFKQTVVRGYSPRLRRWRPLINCAAKWFGSAALPAIGEPISHAFVSHLCSDDSKPQETVPLFRELSRRARGRGIDYLTAGFDSRDPRLPVLLKAFRPRRYLSRLYVVHWDGEGARLAERLDKRLLAPEVALL